MPLHQDRPEPYGPDETVRAARQELKRVELRRARSHGEALKKVEDALRELLPGVTGEVASSGPRILTPEMNRFVLLSAERAALRLADARSLPSRRESW